MDKFIKQFKILAIPVFIIAIPFIIFKKIHQLFWWIIKS
jgi:hypothetical protein